MRSPAAAIAAGFVLAGVGAAVYPTVRRYRADDAATTVVEGYGGAVSMPTPDVTVFMAVPGVGDPRSFGDGRLARLVPALPDVAHFDALNLRGTSVTDAGVALLAGVRQLRRLDVGDTPVTAVGLLRLRGLPDLSEVTVSAGQLSPADVRAIAVAMPSVAVTVWR